MRRFVEEHKLLFVIWVAQLLIALVLAAFALFGARDTVVLTPSQLSAQSGEIRDDARYIDDSFGYQGYFASTPTIQLPRGGYDVKVDILCTADRLNLLVVEKDEGMSLMVDELMLIPTCDGVLEFKVLNFKNNNPFLLASFYQYGVFAVRGLTIEENNDMELMALVAFAILAVVFDAFFYLCKYGSLSRDKRGRQALLALALLIALASLPLLKPGFDAGHDLLFHLMRLEGLADSLRNGLIPARIYSSAIGGYGYASGLFYPDLFLYPAALLRLAGFPLGLCFKLLLFTINILCAVCAYFGYKLIFKRRFIALAAAALSLFASYRLVNVWLRAAVGESLAMCFFPLVTASLWLILRGEGDRDSLRKGIVCGVLGFGGIIQSHIISCVLIGAFALVFLILCIKRVFQKERFKALLKLALVTLLVNLWFLLPMAQQLGGDYSVNSNTTVGFVTAEQALYPSQLFELDARCSGLSLPFSEGFEGEMPCNIGLVLLAAVAVFCIALFKKQALKKPFVKAGLIALAGAALCLFATTYLFPWEWLNAQPLIGRLAAILQFPWRLLSIAAPLLVFVGCAGLAQMKRRTALIATTGALALAAAVQCAFFFSSYVPEYYIYDSLGFNSASIGNREYLPAGTNLDELNRIYHETESVEVEDYSKKGLSVEMTLKNDSGSPGNVRMPLLCYPGYTAQAENTGESLKLYSGENNNLTLEVPAGFEGAVKVEYKGELLWRISDLVSLAAIGLCAYWLIRRRSDTGLEGERSARLKRFEQRDTRDEF